VIGSDEEMQDIREVPRQSDAVDKDGFLLDVEVQSISDTPKVSLKDRSRDVDHFFTPAVIQNNKNYRNCRVCT
jgi:hypothetical protein